MSSTPTNLTSTTLLYQDGTTPYTRGNTGGVPTALSAPTFSASEPLAAGVTRGPNIWSGDGNITAVLPQGFDLYLPVVAPPALLTLASYKAIRPAYYGLASSVTNTPSGSVLDVTAGITVLTPITTSLSTLEEAVPLAAISQSQEGSILQPTGKQSTASSPTTRPEGLSGPTNPAEVPSSARGSDASSTTTGSAEAASTVSKSTFNGAVAGGIIGGAFLGSALCLLVVFCCFKKRKSPGHGGNTAYNGEHTTTRPAAGEKMPRAVESAMPVTGWQKHLPQDKSDGTIRSTFQTLFEHIQMHVDGFYDDTSEGRSDESIALLRRMSEDGVHEMLPGAKEPLAVLEAIMARWLVHRISLRSSTTDSLLPVEFTSIPATCKWDMESDEQHKSIADTFKRGVPQALSQWRMLTAFLRPEPQNDAEFGKALDAKIDVAVSALGKALSPWESSNRSTKDRFKSLQSILQEASQAGILLFRQRSLYVYDWPSQRRADDRSVAVTPALVKKMDEYGDPVQPAQTIVDARWAKV